MRVLFRQGGGAVRKAWKVLASIFSLAPALPLYSGDVPAPPDFMAIQQRSQIAYKVVDLANGGSVRKPASELRCPPLDARSRRVRDARGVVVRLQNWEPAATAAPFFARAESSLAAGRLREAADACAQGLALSPEYGPGWMSAGEVELARKDYAAALGFFRKALALDPSLAPAHRLAADSLVKLGRLSEAEDEYVRALVYNPGYEEVWRSLEELGPKAGFTVHRLATSIPAGAIGDVVDGKVEIGVANPEWLQYLSCKAVWRHEDAYRQARMAAVPRRYSRSVSVAEEMECLRGYVAGHLKGSGQAPEASREKALAAAPELVRTLARVEDAGLLDGFIFFALLGERCPMELALFSDPERGQLERFIRKFVIVRA
jgi:tetratricopeptide (TPR) repeat protein